MYNTVIVLPSMKGDKNLFLCFCFLFLLQSPFPCCNLPLFGLWLEDRGTWDLDQEHSSHSSSSCSALLGTAGNMDVDLYTHIPSGRKPQLHFLPWYLFLLYLFQLLPFLLFQLVLSVYTQVSRLHKGNNSQAEDHPQDHYPPLHNHHIHHH